MTLLNDEEKGALLSDLLERHIDKLPRENSIVKFLESTYWFLKTKDPSLQKKAFSNSEILIDKFSDVLRNQSDDITAKQSVGSLITAFDKVGYADSMDAAAIIMEFEKLLKHLSREEAENLYEDRWISDK